MEDIIKHVGNRIKIYRKAAHLTIQELADKIHKSRSSVSKYENGEIILDVPTLFEISKALSVPMNRFTDIRQESEVAPISVTSLSGKSPFFKAKELHFYFYDGRYKRLKFGLIEILDKTDEPGKYSASFTLKSSTPTGQSSEVFYTGNVVYSDILIRFSFVNQYNALEKDLLYIFNPLDLRDSTYGLLCGISSSDFMPCAFKCLVSLNPKEPTKEMLDELLFTKNELDRWKRINMLVVDNL